jgi:hypothetical protein
MPSLSSLPGEHRADLAQHAQADAVDERRFMRGNPMETWAMNAPTHRRLERLLARLYTREGILLTYSSGHTTGAMETWNNKRGDCLSLSILAYAAARSMRLDAHMQEVPVPMLVDRRSGLDYVSSHVNVFVTTDSEIALHGQVYGAHGFVIDFEPQPGSRRAGQWLTEDGILARYFSNRGTEFMVAKDPAQAYAYYRAAIVAAPDYSRWEVSDQPTSDRCPRASTAGG